jgi:hypothetical protein
MYVCMCSVRYEYELIMCVNEYSDVCVYMYMWSSELVHVLMMSVNHILYVYVDACVYLCICSIRSVYLSMHMNR